MKEKFSEPNGKGKLPTQPIKSNKILSLKQTKEIIDEIYTSKAKFDQKCVDNKLPRETMEQHLYTYLNQKYGLKNLILDWASAIIQAIKKFSNEDNDVAVFGKIMRNEIDEEFRFVQKQLRETVAELLRVYLKGKYARKIDNEIQQMLAQRMTGSLNEDEWVDIIKYMYNKEDSVNVIIKVNEAIRQIRAKKGRRGSNSTGNRGEDDDDDDEKGANRIPYNEFLRVLLNFQLKGHERFLSKFVKLFRQFDSDRNGILNELEFRHLLFTINPHRTEEDIDYWLNYIDPYNNQQITFSECVTFLSADLVKMMSDKKGDFDDDSQTSAEDQQASTMYRLHHSVPPQVQYGTPGSNVDDDEDENIDE
jgi:Ca2+-binding EF-hand superfamily protein